MTLPEKSGARFRGLRTISAVALVASLLQSGAAFAAGTTLRVAPGSLSFAAEVFGVSGATSKPKTVTISNPKGAAKRATIGTLALGGTDPGDFAVEDPSKCQGKSLKPNGNCAVEIIFTPRSLGSRTATLTVTDATGVSPQPISLAGIGIPGTLTYEPPSVTFGSVAVGTSNTQPVVILDYNPVGLEIDQITTTDSQFTATQDCVGGSAIPMAGGGNSCLILVTFTPTSAQPGGAPVDAVLELMDDAAESPQIVTLSGIALTATSSPTPTATPTATPTPTPTPVATAISYLAYQLLDSRTVMNQQQFYLYYDRDSGFNHGFASGVFPTGSNPVADPKCIDDPTNQSNTGCSTNPRVLDQTHGTVFQLNFAPLPASQPNAFAGVNIEEPENYGVCHVPHANPSCRNSKGYDLRGAKKVVLQARSPGAMYIKFGINGCNTAPMPISSTWETVTIPLNQLFTPGTLNSPCKPSLNGVHVLLSVLIDSDTSDGGVILLDKIQFLPTPALKARSTALGFPFANQTFGALPQYNPLNAVPDQALRNLAPIYESAIAEIAFLERGTSQDRSDAKLIADTFHYALHHDSHGDPLPKASHDSGSVGLHNAYENGDIALFNSQLPPKKGVAGDARLAGFSANCFSGFCSVLDDSTGGNNAFAILALVDAFYQLGDLTYLKDAEEIGDWVASNLMDSTGTGYGGYYVGYFGEDDNMPGVKNTGKSTENNGDLFAAFTALAQADPADASQWTNDANVAGDFVMQMYDCENGRFNLGTVPTSAPPPPSNQFCPGPTNGSDILNACDFLDANTFPTLAMAASPRYHAFTPPQCANPIDWRLPIEYVMNKFAGNVTVNSANGESPLAFSGFNIVPPSPASTPSPTSGANGVAWEFTGQEVEALRFVYQLYGQSDPDLETAANSYLAQIGQAQTSAPFNDGMGLVASTLQNGDLSDTPPAQECLNTPFQCIAERVGIAATTWAIFADLSINPFQPIGQQQSSALNLTTSKSRRLSRKPGAG